MLPFLLPTYIKQFIVSKMMIVASDLDGVIAVTSFELNYYKPSRLREFYNSCTPTKYAKMIFDYIITGRKEYFRKLTENWLKENNVKYGKLVMYPTGIKKSLDGVYQYKTKVINNLGIVKYYENHKGIYNHLKENCMSAEIIFVDRL